MSRPVRTRRVYDPPSHDDGYRVLVDSLWPRGLKKADAALDEWCRDAAPSTGLRKWFAHDPERSEEFARRYREELETKDAVVERLCGLAASGQLTLVYAARDTEHNNAVVLARVIDGRTGAQP